MSFINIFIEFILCKKRRYIKCEKKLDQLDYQRVKQNKRIIKRNGSIFFGENIRIK
jgi:hypothetical protein